VAWKRLDADVTRGLAGWAGLACIAVVAVRGWVHFAQAGHPPAAAQAAPARRPAPVTLPAGEARAWKAFPSYRGVVPVVMYHSIGGRPSYLTTSRIQFAQQMHALKLGGFHTLTIAQYAAYVRGHAAGLPARPILLTFDDGRQDAYLAANGILRSYGFHATELAVPGWVTGHPGFSLSWDEIAQMSHGTTWNIESHFGYGPEKVQISKTGATGARLGYLQYLPAVPGRPGHPGHLGHLETFARFRKQFTGNELWGIHGHPRLQLRSGRHERPAHSAIRAVVAGSPLRGRLRRGLPEPGQQPPPVPDPRPVLAEALLPHVDGPGRHVAGLPLPAARFRARGPDRARAPVPASYPGQWERRAAFRHARCAFACRRPASHTSRSYSRP
jgi:hypothetical protein